jgi:hypothetical protein
MRLQLTKTSFPFDDGRRPGKDCSTAPAVNMDTLLGTQTATVKTA